MLSEPGPNRSLGKELYNIQVGLVFPKTRLEYYSYQRFKYAGIVNGYQANVFMTIPAWLAAPGVGFIHCIVPNQVNGIENFDKKSKHKQILNLRCGKIMSA
jgi:hypothetical protein